jgi:Ras-related protein Rab-18
MANVPNDALDHVFKILLIGEAGVGKSSVLLQFTDEYFNENLQTTIGVDFKVKVMDSDAPDGRMKKVKVTIWDTAGQERFRTLTSSYYRGAQGIILVYDVSTRETFNCLETWMQEVEQFTAGGGKDVVKLLVGNKIDKERVVAREEGVAWAKARGMLFMETSAKTSEGINQVFHEIVQKILETPVLLTNTRPAKAVSKKVALNQAGNNRTSSSSSKSKCCA